MGERTEHRDGRGVAHVVALSGGKDSTALALRLAEVEPRPYIYVCTPTGDELPPMHAHWDLLERLLGAPLIRLPNAGLVGAIHQERMIPNWRARWCTRKLKIVPYMAFLRSVAPAVSYVGLRADEETREGVSRGGDLAFTTGEVRQRYPLREWGWDIDNVLTYLLERGIRIPARTDCGACFYQRLGEWWNLWKTYPDRWAEYEALEQQYGHTFRSLGRDSWPAALTDLRQAFESGRTPKEATEDAQLPLFERRQQMCRTCAM